MKKINEISVVEKSYFAFNDQDVGSNPITSTKIKKKNGSVAQRLEQDMSFFAYYLICFKINSIKIPLTSVVEKSYFASTDQVVGSNPIISTKNFKKWECSSAVEQDKSFFAFNLVKLIKK
ncbi:MAG: hypothetical protein IPI52_03875 [Bacteroidetes bacterium]|nr:hypothetical protein [Bacteroidota bacterium]